MDDFITHLRASGDLESTVKLRLRHLTYLGNALGRDPATATMEELEAFLATEGWSKDYRKSIRSSFSTFFHWLQAVGRRADNPTALLVKCKAAAPAPRPLPEDAYERAASHPVPHIRAMARLGGEVGLRRSEIAAVHRDAIWRDLLGWSITVIGKGEKTRILPLSDDLAEFLLSFHSVSWLFPGRFEGHVSSDYVGRRLKELCPPGYAAHAFRHRFAAVTYYRSGDIRAVQELLGHASLETTQRYVPTSAARLRTVAAMAA